MVHLVSDPPALYFPKVYLFDDPQHTDIMVKRSDGKGNVVCSVEIPDALKQTGLLKVENNTEANISGRCEFVLNPRAATDTGRFSEKFTPSGQKIWYVAPHSIRGRSCRRSSEDRC